MNDFERGLANLLVCIQLFKQFTKIGFTAKSESLAKRQK